MKTLVLMLLVATGSLSVTHYVETRKVRFSDVTAFFNHIYEQYFNSGGANAPAAAAPRAD